jgi:hypothetical protein
VTEFRKTGRPGQPGGVGEFLLLQDEGDLGQRLLQAGDSAVRHPAADDRGGQLPDPGLGQGVRVGVEAAGERLAGSRRQRAQQADDAVLVAPDHQRHVPRPTASTRIAAVSR